ncbi:MAG: bifunctional phosphoribosyl-AMP cyclohydrolase/phosphoribosyl-ATP diphosphatase HisIE [Pseudobdellovibrionaceae bacterium]
MTAQDIIQKINWKKVGDLVPVVVQDDISAEVLMLGYMNPLAIETTFLTGKVTFWSRTKNALWTKGETSGNFLKFVSTHLDCDQDTLLVMAVPDGPTCHRNTFSCFSSDSRTKEHIPFLNSLIDLIKERKAGSNEKSYVSTLLKKPDLKVLQKVGEEAVEFILAATDTDTTETLSEAADLLFHFLVALEKKNLSYTQVIEVLRQRHHKA